MSGLSGGLQGTGTWMASCAAAAILTCAFPPSATAQESQCYGEINRGRIEGSVQVSPKGPNFQVIGWSGAARRTFAHSAVKKILEQAYAATAEVIPDSVFLIGETGLADGGPITNHHTHQRGTSVDLFVPAKDADGKRVLIPSRLDNGFGYKSRFGADGKSADHSVIIDFEALAELIYQLSETARKNGYGIDRVILVRELQLKLFGTRHGSYLRWKVNFWDDPGARHDNHIHVDFAIPCKPL
ncbi:penicillin-insensitive murein endopeptidase [Polaromonas sp.]|uniref:penicillin-insensitive murein endopeptidase n=1 Tax=Polaromonas sp. TaxID=1869339 RepID=UPI003267474A